MPCSSTDDGSWGGCFASSPLATEPGSCLAAGSRHTNSSRRPQPAQQCKAGAPEAAACRPGCRNSSEQTIDNNFNESATVTGVAAPAPHVRAVTSASSSANPSAAPVPPLPPFSPMQLAATASARAAARDANCEGNGSDCDSDLDFFTPLSSPLRDLPTPSIPVAAVAQGSNAIQDQQEQLSQQQQQLLPQRVFLEISGSNDHGSQLLYSSRQQQSTSTSSLPPAKECGLLLGRFPLRRRYLSADCGGSRLQQEQQLRPPTQAATAAAAAEMHLLAKTTASATGKDRMPLIHRVPRAPLQSRRCQGGSLLYQQQKHQFQWMQQHRRPLLQQEQQLRQQQHALQREASDEDIRMPLVPPPSSSSPLLASSRVAPPAVTSVPFHTEEGTAAPAAAADFSAAANPQESTTVVVPETSHSSDPDLQSEEEEQQLNAQSSLLPTVCQHHQQPEGQITQHKQPSHAQQQQQLPRDDSEGFLQCSKRRRFSVERNDLAFALPTGQVGALIPPNACIHATSNSEEGELQRQQSQQHMESGARVEELDFSSHRKRKRGGECSARLLLMLQPNAAAADAALLDVLGTALTAEETRELRMQQQKEAEAAAAAAAAEEAAARERTAAAAAAEAAAARAKAAAEAEEVAARAKAQASEAAMVAAAATASRTTTERSPNTLLQGGVTASVAAHDAACGVPLFGTTRKCEPHQQLQPLPVQERQPQLRQPQEHQIQQQAQQPQLQLEQPHGDKLKGTAGTAPGLGDLGVMQGVPKLRIRRANGTPGAAAVLAPAGPGVSAAPQQTVDFQQRQQQKQPPFATPNPSLRQQMPVQQQMDVQGSAFQPPQVQQHLQYAQQPQPQQQVQKQQPPADGLGLGLAEFGPTKVPDVSDAGNNPFAFVAGRGRGRGGRRGGMRRR